MERWSIDRYRQHTGQQQASQGKAKRNKYNAKKVEVDGKIFDSMKEAERFVLLRAKQQAGKIRGLELQPVFPIVIDGEPLKIRSKGYPNGRAVKAKMDFVYFEGQERIVEDVKGLDNPTSRLKRALVEHIYHVKIRLI